MYANIIIPTLVSESVDDELVPALSKLIERNIALNYRDVFLQVIKLDKRFKPSVFRTIMGMSESSNTLPPSVTETFLEAVRESKLDTLKATLREYKEDLKNARTPREREIMQRTIDQTEELIRDNEDYKKNRSKIIGSRGKKSDKKRKSKVYKKLKQKYGKTSKKSKEEERRKHRGFKTPDRSPDRADITRPEVPRGINMYTTISLEPTILEFTYTEGDNEIPLWIGFKVVPFKIKDISTFMSVIRKDRIMKGVLGYARSSIKRGWRKLRKNLPFSKARHISKGRAPGFGTYQFTDPGDEAWDDVHFSLDYDDLTDSKKISSLIRAGRPALAWAALTILSTDDFEEGDVEMESFFKDYKKLARVGWGDIVIINPDKEEVNFCSLSILACNRLSYSQLGKIISLPNVIDFNSAKRFDKPFSTSPKRII